MIRKKKYGFLYNEKNHFSYIDFNKLNEKKFED